MKEVVREEVLRWETEAATRLFNTRNYEDRRKLYSEIYNKDNIFWLKQHGAIGISGKSAKDYLLLRAAFLGNGPILDVGGGTGIAGNAFNETRIYVVCDASMASLCFPVRGNDSITRMKAAGYATELPFRDRTFEGALLLDVMEHLHPDDIELCLEEIKRVIRPGGRLLISTPNRISGPWDMRRGYPEWWNRKGLHLSEMTVCRMITLVKRHGFQPFAFLTKPYKHRLFHFTPLLFWATIWERIIRLLPWRLRPRLCELSIVLATLPYSGKESR